MAEGRPPDSLRQRILENMREKDTEELLDIWKKNNRKAWSNDAFDVIHEILLKRLGSVPEQAAPTGDDISAESGGQDDENSEEMGNEDVFHDAQVILRTATLANIASWVVLLIGAGIIVLRLLSDLTEFQSPSFINLQTALTFQTISNVLAGTLAPIFYFVVFRAVSQLLYILLDIERNTYLARKTQS